MCHNYSKQKVSQNGTTFKTRFGDNRKAINKKLMTSDFAQHILDTKHNKKLTITDVNNKGIYMKTIRRFHLCNNRKKGEQFEDNTQSKKLHL